MSDIISGIVSSLINADTFELKVITVGDGNRHSYAGIEKIKAVNFEIFNSADTGNSNAKPELEPKMLGAAVRCIIHGRDDHGNVLADVSLYGFKSDLISKI